MSLNIKIDGKKYEVEEGQKILKILSDNNIEVPHLCNHENYQDFAKKIKAKSGRSVCRVCFVKVKCSKDENFRLMPSCEVVSEEGMEIKTKDDELIRIRRTNLELLFADHAGLCASCIRNMDCELQSAAFQYDIDEFRFVPKLNEISDQEELDLLYDKMNRRVVDLTNPCISRDSEKCINCRRCLNVCKYTQTVEAYGVSGRGVESSVGTEYDTPLECTYCGQCTSVCPTAALTEKNEINELIKAVKDPDKQVIIQTAPSIRVSIGEEVGMAPGAILTGKMVSALRKIGADIVFDTNFSADLTIMEEANELIERVKKKSRLMPLFTSCCPAWVLFLEQNYPEFLKHLSTCKSPQMMMGSMIKNYWAKKSGLKPENIFSASIMPCICKKYENQRPEFIKKGIKDVDCTLTTRELGRMIRNQGIKLTDLEDSDFDPTLGMATSAGAIFGSSGGVTEAALRTAYHFITGRELDKLEFKAVRGEKHEKQTEVAIDNVKLRIKVVHGLGNARKVMEKMKHGEIDFDFLEVMACPGGCIGGGGQPIPTSPKIRKLRAKAIMSQDKNMKLRRSHQNPMIKEIYEKFLAAPGSRKSHKYLHTSYYPYKPKWR